MMHRTSAFLIVFLVAFSYLAALVVVDSGRNVFARVADVAAVLPVLLAASLAGYGIRALRWLTLLQSLGHRVPFRQGLFGYIAGFAFTASPGKAGELVRVRYFSWYGVPASHVVAVFVFERVLDLVVLLLFASLIANSAAGFGIAVGFVGLMLGCLTIAARWPRMRYHVQRGLRRMRLRLLARATRAVFRGIEQTAQFLPAPILVPAAMLGVLAWSIQCIGYAVVLRGLGIDLSTWLLFAIPPAAILFGAASMMPGGIGTTEAATVVLLAQFGVELHTAVLASIAIRLGSIWFATLLGFAAVAWLEMAPRKPA